MRSVEILAIGALVSLNSTISPGLSIAGAPCGCSTLLPFGVKYSCTVAVFVFEVLPTIIESETMLS